MPIRKLHPDELRRLRRSEYSRTWGDLDAESMAALTEHVKGRGVMHPATARGREVLDGWHRIQAAIAAGRSCDVEILEGDFSDEHLVEMVTAENALRRNLSKGEAAQALARLRLQEDGSASATVEADATLLGCSERMIQMGRAAVRRRRGIAPPPGGNPKAEEPGDPAIPQESGGEMMAPSAAVGSGIKPEVPAQPQGVSSENVPGDIGDVVRETVAAAELLAAMSKGTELAARARVTLRAISAMAAALPVNYRRTVTRDVTCIVDGEELAPELVDGLRSCCDGCLRGVPQETLLGVLRRKNPGGR